MVKNKIINTFPLPILKYGPEISRNQLNEKNC